MKNSVFIKQYCIILLLLTIFITAGCTGNSETITSEVTDTDSTKSSLQDTAGSGPDEHGHLRAEQGNIIDENGNKYQLRGLSTHGVGWYPDYVNAGAMKSVREKGGNVMRAAMYTEADSGYLSEPERNMNIVIQAIENARAMDMYIIVDWHILDDGDPNKHLEKAITFFDAVASRYPDDPAIIYEVCNEPNHVSWSDIKKYAYSICPVIRQYSPNAVIILGTPDFSFGIDSPLTEPFEQENVLYSYHFYAGLHNDFSILKQAVSEELPVIVSEWGICNNTDGKPFLELGESFVSYLNENEVSWCAWSLCNKDEAYSVLRSDCNKLSGWQESDFTEVGKIVFNNLEGKDK